MLYEYIIQLILAITNTGRLGCSV